MAKDVTARVTRSDGWWAISVDEIPGLFTQARRLDQVADMVRDAASLLGVGVGTVEVQPVLDSDSQRMLDIASLVGLSQQRVAVLSKDV